MEPKQKRRRPWITILVIAVVVIVFLVLFDVRAVIDEIVNADWVYLGAATAVLLIGYLILAVRWRYLLGDRPGTRYTFNTMNVSNMANLMTFIPVTAIRIVLMGEHAKVTISQATSSVSLAVVVDLVVKILSLLLAILLGVASRSSTTILIIGILLIVGMVVGIILVLVNAEKIAAKIIPILARIPRISEDQAQGMVSSFLEGLEGGRSPRRLMVTFLLSILIWICMLAFYYLGLLAFGLSFPVNRMLVAVMAAYFFVNPASPYLPGVFQALLVVPLYFVLRTDVDTLIGFSIVLHVILLVIWFGLGSSGLRRLNLSFSTLRQQISDSVHAMRSEYESTSIAEDQITP